MSVRRMRRRAGRARKHLAPAVELLREELPAHRFRSRRRLRIAATLGRWSQHRDLQLYVLATLGPSFRMKADDKLGIS